MDRILIVGASSDLSKSYIDYIFNSEITIDILVRDLSKFSKKILNRFNKIYEYDLNQIEKLESFKTENKYSQIIFFQGIDIIKPFHLFKSSDINNIFNINLISTISILKKLVSNKNLLKNSSVVIISSISGTTKGTPGHVIYSSSKSALIGLVKSLSLELSKRKIRINLISPGLIKTNNLYAKNSKLINAQEKEIYESKYPLGLGEKDTLNGIINFLLNENSNWITGQNIIVDGGNSNV